MFYILIITLSLGGAGNILSESRDSSLGPYSYQDCVATGKTIVNSSQMVDNYVRDYGERFRYLSYRCVKSEAL